MSHGVKSPFSCFFEHLQVDLSKPCGVATREYHPVAANNGEAYLLHLNNAIWRTINGF